MSAVRVIQRAGRDRLGEGLCWSPREGVLYWTDILGRRLHRLTLESERVDSWDVPDVIGWAVERESGGLLAGVGRAVVALSLDPFAMETVAALDEPADNRVNDAKADADGRLWFGTMPFSCDRPTGSLWRLDRGSLSRVGQGYTIPNGPAIDPAGRFILHTDTALRTVFRYPLTDGVPGGREPFIRFEDGWGDPDGMTLDAAGHLWVACWGAGCVARFTPDGARERVIALPASQITNVAFAGPDLDRLFVTSAAEGVDESDAGALFEVDPGCRGLLPFRYAD